MIKIEELKKLLEENPEVSAYEIRQTVNDDRQLYFVLGRLETSRAVNAETVNVTVYHDFDGFRGSSAFAITANDNEKTIKEKTVSAVTKAKAVRNPYYPLAEKSRNLSTYKQLSEPMTLSLKKVADDIFAADHFENSSLNATEIFGCLEHVRFINSNGVDHSFDETSLFAETIPSYKNETDEYELYYCQSEGDLNAPFKANVEEALRNVRYRAEARTPKEVNLPENLEIAVKGEMLGLLMGNFADDLSYASLYNKMNHYGVGDEISPLPFDITMMGELKGALSSSPIDDHGLLLDKTRIIEAGKAAALWGDIRYGSYLKEEKITGNYSVIVLDNYQPDDEALNRPHLTIMNFSSPQLDSASGYFGGEVRLALYEHDGLVEPLTGFSISGNIYEEIRTATFSSEKAFINERRTSGYGPKYMFLKGMKIH